MEDASPLAIDAVAEESVSDGVPDRLAISPSLQVEQGDLQTVTIYLRSTGTRLRVPRKLYELLLEFETPRAMSSVASGDARIATAIGTLREKGFLIAQGEAAAPSPQRLVTDPPVRLFDCPAQKLVPSETDVVVLGVPYDLGDAAAAGARQGPAAIRETSLQLLYGIDRHTARPRGWFDADIARPILQGVTIGDCGDVFVDPGEPQAAMFARIAEILDRVASEATLPVLLGGDAATGFPIIDFLQARSALSVISVGSAAAGATAHRGGFVSPRALPGRVLALPGVRRYVDIGAHAHAEDAPCGLGTVSAPQFREEGRTALARHLDEGERVYVGLDLDALVRPGDADNGSRFTYAELHALLRAIGEHHAIAGLGVVGARPREAWSTTSMAAIHLLLTGLSAAKDSMGEAAP